MNTPTKGPLAYMANNPVAANLLMGLLIIGGLMLSPTIKQEVFPEISQDAVNISVPYPGASPTEVETGILLSIEEAVRGIDGVEQVSSKASEGSGTIVVELLTGTDHDAALSDVRSAVDRITSLPEDAERATVSLAKGQQKVLSLVISGPDLDDATLRSLSEQIRDGLMQDERITLVQAQGIKAPEISIEVPQENLRRYGLTLDQVAAAVRKASVELPGGSVKTSAGEVLLRTSERRNLGMEFSEIVVVSRPGGTSLTLGDLGAVIDGSEELDQEATMNGDPAARLLVYRVGDQTPLSVSTAVKDYLANESGNMPPGVDLQIWNDDSDAFADRVDLLLRNAYLGLALVLIILGLFLEVRLAFWVTMGIPISFLGAMLFMPMLGASINMVSMFAFILALGIVVDDAIVVGEAVYKHRQDGLGPMEAAVAGVKEVSGAVTASVLTTVLAFSPLLFIPGPIGQIFSVIPLVVIPVLLLSLVESLFILPAHLAHETKGRRSILGFIRRGQKAFSDLFERGVERFYEPAIKKAVEARYLTLAAAISALVLTAGLAASGALAFSFLPKIEGDTITASVQMPIGTPVEETRALSERMVAAAHTVMADLNEGEGVSRGIYAEVGSASPTNTGPIGGSSLKGSHVAKVEIFLIPGGDRSITTARFTRLWREALGEVAGVDQLSFNYNTGPSAGAAVSVELSHPDTGQLELAAERLADDLGGFAGVFDIDEGLSRGKAQLDLTLKPEARRLGVTEEDLARQVRAAFFGTEVTRQQRGRDELKIVVRRPADERRSEHDIEGLLILTNEGGEVPLAQAATLSRGRAYTEINRKNGRRIVTVTADIDEEVTTGNAITGALKGGALASLEADFPGLRVDFSGEQQEQADALGTMARGFALALMAMFALMAVAFRSYLQPIIIMSAIPFGLIGAMLGHMMMGFDLSVMSIMGLVALSGVIVNDSLVLVTAINTYRKKGMALLDAVVAGGARRVRPVLLTSLTTFFGLAPMILETSAQARFLVPMAISLGFGILFVTFIALLLVPALYMIVEDLRRFGAWIGDKVGGEEAVSVGEVDGVSAT